MLTYLQQMKQVQRKESEERVQLATTIISTVSVVCNIYLIFYIRKMN